MKLSQAIIAAAPFLQAKQALSGPSNLRALQSIFYPDWKDSTVTCLSDGLQDSTIMNGTYYESTAEKCCDRFYSWDYCNCLENSGGTPCTGTDKWYVDYEKNKCHQDCPTGGANALCGGLAASSEQLFASETLCCEGKLSYIARALCEANSLGVPYLGSSKYYVDYENSKCVQDCNTTTDGCGGIVEDASVALYADAAACCAGKLSYVNEDLCASLSDPLSNGTGMFYADGENKMCILDNDVCPTGNTCARATFQDGKLFADAATCCKEGLAWVNSVYCESLTTGTRSGKWFVDYESKTCVNDCADGSLYCANITDLANPPADFYDSAAKCCESKLGWVNADTCEAASLAGADNYNGTSTWYASSEGNICVKDCDATANNDTLCGGILEVGSSMTLHADETACCKAHFSWYSSDLCVARSTATYTNKYYVGGSDKCAQDCDPAAGGACAGNPEELSLQLFDTDAACCQAKFSWINKDACIASTSNTTASGSGKYYIDWSLNQCVLDCPEDSGVACGGLPESWDKIFNTENACCDAIHWVERALCVKGSTRAPTQAPTDKPTKSPTLKPTSSPTKAPTSSPTKAPTAPPM